MTINPDGRSTRIFDGDRVLADPRTASHPPAGKRVFRAGALPDGMKLHLRLVRAATHRLSTAQRSRPANGRPFTRREGALRSQAVWQRSGNERSPPGITPPRKRGRASGGTVSPLPKARAIIEAFATIQMVDVHLPTTDGRHLVLPRHTRPNKEHELLLQRLGMRLPQQPAPRITA